MESLKDLLAATVPQETRDVIRRLHGTIATLTSRIESLTNQNAILESWYTEQKAKAEYWEEKANEYIGKEQGHIGIVDWGQRCLDNFPMPAIPGIHPDTLST